MSAIYGLIDGPAGSDYCEISSRCTWNNNKPVPWCSLHEHEEVCKNVNPNYKLIGCYPDKELCEYNLKAQKYLTTTQRPKPYFSSTRIPTTTHIPKKLSSSVTPTPIPTLPTILLPKTTSSSLLPPIEKKVSAQESKCNIL